MKPVYPGLLGLFTFLVSVTVSAQTNQLESQVDCATGTTTLAYGQSVTCQIDDNLDQDQFQFSAEVDDLVTITLVKTGGGERPWAEFVSPDGVILETKFTGYAAGSSVDYTFTALQDGVYGINVKDSVAGYYRVQLDSNQTALDDTYLMYGVKSQHRMDYARDRDYFALDMVAGTTVAITLGKFSGLERPSIQVYDPYSMEIEPSPKYTGYSENSQVTYVVQALVGGTYTIEVTDYSTPGYYELFAACNAGTCPTGGKPQPSLDFLAGMAHAKSLTADDVVEATMATVNSDLSILLPIAKYGTNPPEYLRAELTYIGNTGNPGSLKWELKSVEFQEE